jgi:hypothetical protein
MKFDAVNGIWSTNSSALKDPSVVSKVAIGFVVDDAIACIRLLLALPRVLREEEETTFLITRRSDDVEDILSRTRPNEKMIKFEVFALLVFFSLVVRAILRRDNVYNMWYHYALKSSY